MQPLPGDPLGTSHQDTQIIAFPSLFFVSCQPAAIAPHLQRGRWERAPERRTLELQTDSQRSGNKFQIFRVRFQVGRNRRFDFCGVGFPEIRNSLLQNIEAFIFLN